MKNYLIGIVFLCLWTVSFAQNDNVLLTINEKPVYVSEFKRIYEKNLDQVNDDEKGVEKNLELFINYKLKLIEAYSLGLDTSKTFKSEYRSYKNQLMNPYLQDEDFKQQLVREAYDRTIQEVRASHILVAVPNKTINIDTIAILKKLDTIKKKINEGIDFNELASKLSDDPSAKMNGGDLGYFSAFRMVYPFEEAAYTTEVGAVSEAFKTRFGYHILKVTDKRRSKGAFDVAHILIRGMKSSAKVKIDSVYRQLQRGADFDKMVEQYSEDKGSVINGGKLPRFTSGRMVPAFENSVFKLTKEGQISEPFKTRYGWHIVKLIKNYPVGSFEDLKPELESKIRTSNRGKLSLKKLIRELKSKYTITINNDILEKVKENRDIKCTALDCQKMILSVANKIIPLKDLLTTIRSKKYLTVDQLWNQFLEDQILDYYKGDLVNLYPEYKNTLQEYKDGLLLFDLMKAKIWDFSQKDQEGLAIFFDNNRSRYKVNDLEEVKGEVISDYQKYLEEEWIKSLRKKNTIQIMKKTLKKLKKFYKQ